MEPADYQAWLSGGSPGETLAGGGAKRFVEHAVQHLPRRASPAPAAPRSPASSARWSTSRSGQSLIADEAYIRESIVNPQARLVAGYPPIMPTFQGLISEEGLLQLMAYIKSLPAAPAAGGAEAVPAGPPVAPGPLRTPERTLKK